MRVPPPPRPVPPKHVVILVHPHLENDASRRKRPQVFFAAYVAVQIHKKNRIKVPTKPAFNTRGSADNNRCSRLTSDCTNPIRPTHPPTTARTPDHQKYPGSSFGGG